MLKNSCMGIRSLKTDTELVITTICIRFTRQGHWFEPSTAHHAKRSPNPHGARLCGFFVASLPGAASRRDDQTAEGLAGGWQFLAFDAAKDDAAVVAQELHAIAAGDREQGFGAQALEVDSGYRGWPVVVPACPAEKDEVALFAGGAGDDQVARADEFDTADAALAEVEFERFAEARVLAGDDFVWVVERDE